MPNQRDNKIPSCFHLLVLLSHEDHITQPLDTASDRTLRQLKDLLCNLSRSFSYVRPEKTVKHTKQTLSLQHHCHLCDRCKRNHEHQTRRPQSWEPSNWHMWIQFHSHQMVDHCPNCMMEITGRSRPVSKDHLEHLQDKSAKRICLKCATTLDRAISKAKKVIMSLYLWSSTTSINASLLVVRQMQAT